MITHPFEDIAEVRETVLDEALGNPGTRIGVRHTIDLTTARVSPGVLLGAAGNFLYVEALDGTLELAFNNPDSTRFTLNEGDVFRVTFSQLFLVNTAQSGLTAKLIIGAGALDLALSPRVQGEIAHDAVDRGMPIKIGGRADTGDPGAVSDGDRVNAWFAERGQMAVMIGSAGGSRITVVDAANTDGLTANSNHLFGMTVIQGVAPDAALDRVKTLADSGPGFGAMAVGARTPGSSEIKTIVVAVGATSVDRADVVAAQASIKYRLVSVTVTAMGLTTDPEAVSVFHGTGAGYTTNPTKAITQLSPGTTGTQFQRWGDGEGPVGADNEAISWKTETETETPLYITVSYREE